MNQKQEDPLGNAFYAMLLDIGTLIVLPSSLLLVLLVEEEIGDEEEEDEEEGQVDVCVICLNFY